MVLTVGELSIFLTLLLPKPPKAGDENDDCEKMTEGITEKSRSKRRRSLFADEEAEAKPVHIQTDTGMPIPEPDRLIHTLESFLDGRGSRLDGRGQVKKQIRDIVEETKKDKRYRDAMKFADVQDDRDGSGRAAWKVVMRNIYKYHGRGRHLSKRAEGSVLQCGKQRLGGRNG